MLGMSCYEGAPYPGATTDSPYVLVDGVMCGLAARGGRLQDARVIAEGPTTTTLAALLARQGATPLERRYVVLAFGANRNAANLVWKMRRGGQERGCVVVVPAWIEGADVAAANVFYSGQFYADLLWDDALVADTRVRAALLLLDLPQLQWLHRTEEVPSEQTLATGFEAPGCGLAETRGLTLLTAHGAVPRALMYVSWSTLFAPTGNRPVAFADVGAHGRRIPAACQDQLWGALARCAGAPHELLHARERLRQYWQARTAGREDPVGRALHEQAIALAETHAYHAGDGAPRTGLDCARNAGTLLSPSDTWSPPEQYRVPDALPDGAQEEYVWPG